MMTALIWRCVSIFFALRHVGRVHLAGYYW